ncbi:hypothetical protein EIN_371790 [Entamoeba invadens IP1]|uniref:Uncharacterized protein n=1 Tax=Entamoeba invadens IP1 TaxID=370355 RepID=A0A0A1UGK9_ENTIV|nr:hypothetical protein EIN_371790 [Entamoeba invadens IP1]ELP92767.1 hypothetical protein EIN_371790 [Entamoeba invadens IP1]|eukprot:XP_004259538.1 hypothetical protein EIN_371790 [Entamoeba invadens IP1]
MEDQTAQTCENGNYQEYRTPLPLNGQTSYQTYPPFYYNITYPYYTTQMYPYQMQYQQYQPFQNQIDEVDAAQKARERKEKRLEVLVSLILFVLGFFCLITWVVNLMLFNRSQVKKARIMAQLSWAFIVMTWVFAVFTILFTSTI